MRSPAAAGVQVHLDSSYVMHGFTKGWIASWRSNGWRNSAKEPVKNRELWEQLLAQADRHEVEWVLVKGHDGVERNERVDALAVAQRDLHAVAHVTCTHVAQRDLHARR